MSGDECEIGNLLVSSEDIFFCLVFFVCFVMRLCLYYLSL